METTNNHDLPPASDREKSLEDARRSTDEAGELWQQKRYAEAEPLYARALQTYERLLGSSDPDLANALRNMANVRYVQERFRKAHALYRRAASVYEAIDPASHELANTLHWMGQSAFMSQRYKKAAAAYERAIELLEATDPDGSPELQSELMDLAHLYFFVGRYADAEPVYLRALAMAELVLGSDHVTVGRCTGRIANLYRRAEFLEKDPEPFYRRAVEVWEKSEDDIELFEAIYRLADFLHEIGRDDEAEPLYAYWLKLLEHVGDRADAEDEWGSGTRWMRNGYLDYLRATRRTDQADALAIEWGPHDAYGSMVRRQLERLESSLGPDDPKLAMALLTVGTNDSFAGNDDEGEQKIRRALGILERSRGPEHPDVADALGRLAAICRRRERYDEAGLHLERALRILEGSPETDDRGRILEQRAALATACGDLDGAEEGYREALEVYRRVHGPKSRRLAEGLFHFAAFALHHGRAEQAATLAEEAVKMAHVDIDVEDIEKADYLDLYAAALRDLGRENDAEEAAAESKAIWERHRAEAGEE